MYDNYFEIEFIGTYVRTNMETGEMEMSQDGGPWKKIDPIMPDSIGAWTPLEEKECFDLIDSIKICKRLH